jgi:hypothetical protein
VPFLKTPYMLSEPLFTSGKKKKIEYKQTTWINEEIDYYEKGQRIGK